MAERYARFFVTALLLGLFSVIAAARWSSQQGVIEIHAAMPEVGGWSLDGLTVEAGQPLELRLVSDDVLHGFAVGQDERYNLDLQPGVPVETTLVFDKPGKYVFFCSRWCGPNHWRMRGTIDVTGQSLDGKTAPPPLFVALGLDIDSEHGAENVPQGKPSAPRGALQGADIPSSFLTTDYYQTHSPSEVWQELRDKVSLAYLDDGQIWDLVAFIWSLQTTPGSLADGERLYAANCAACHGESGAGDGVMAGALTFRQPSGIEAHSSNDHGDGHSVGPTDFTDAKHLLGASPAILHGKIVRGGMGTNMPYWGPIFADQQIWNLVSYLWTFQFLYEE